MSVKSWLTKQMFGNELAEIKRVNNALLDAWQFSMTPAGLLQNIGELDSQLLDLLIDLQRYEEVGRYGVQTSEQDRLRSVEVSRYYERTDVLTGLAVDMWTDFGFGQTVNIAPSGGDVAREVWNECWTAPRNRTTFSQDSIHERFSSKLLIDGERFFVAYVSTLDGTTTWRIFDTTQVKGIVAAKNDPAIKLWYIVEGEEGKQLAFPDAFAVFAFAEMLEKYAPSDGAENVNIEAMQNNTFAAIVPAQRNIDENGRGCPQFRRAFPWSRTTRENLENHAAVSRLVATYVDKIEAKGGQRAIDAIRNSLQSSLVNNNEYWDTNPAPAAGSTWLQNEQIDRTRMPLGTGARDAQTDSMVFLSMAAAGYKVPPHWLMRPDMLQNRSVADEMAKPAMESWRRYQTFWAARFGDIVEVTLRFRNKFDASVTIDDYSALIEMESPLDLETDELTGAMDSFSKAAVSGTLSMDVAQRANTVLVKLLLSDFGINDPSGVVDAQELDALTQTVLENYYSGSISKNALKNFLINELIENE